MLFTELQACSQMITNFYENISKWAKVDPDLIKALEAVRSKFLAIEAAVMKQESRLKDLENQLQNKNMVYDKVSGASFDPEDQDKSRPFCTRCLQEHQRRSNLQWDEMGSYCRICKEIYMDAEQRKRVDADVNCANDEAGTYGTPYPKRKLW